MTKQISQLVIFRDGRQKPTRYFGPFVSSRIAQEFADDLPAPLEGGYKLIKPTQPFTQNEGTIVREKLLSER